MKNKTRSAQRISLAPFALTAALLTVGVSASYPSEESPGPPAPEQPAGGIASAPAAPPGCTTSSMTFTNSTPTAIPDTPTTTPDAVSTITVSGADIFIWDVNVTTFITHTFAADLDITLKSPAGTIVTLTSDNGANDVYNGTVWDDDADPDGQVLYGSNEGLVTDCIYENLVVETPLVPEEAMGAFIGENPNGVWTLSVDDDASGNIGALNTWTLDILAAPAAPPTTTTTFSNPATTAIPDGPATVTSTIVVSGLDMVLTDANLTTAITHCENQDLDITIMSPTGTIVTLTTDNGGISCDAFSNVLWDDDADPDNQVPFPGDIIPGSSLVTDRTFTLIPKTLVPEEAMGAFIGENPNGTWTLTVGDDTGNSKAGSLNGWSLDLTTATAAPTLALTSVTNETAVPIVPYVVVTSTLTVSGLAHYLWDVDLTTFITHTAVGDFDMSLTSPAGTIVTIVSNRGGGNENVFNGTLFDDDADPDGQVPYTSNNGMATDHAYVDLTTATPLTPEEPLGAFIGENPNGIWTLNIADEFVIDEGSLNSWSLTLTALDSAPTNDPVVTASNSTSQAITTGAPPQVITSTVTVSTLGPPASICDVNATVNITHTDNAELDFTLMSPAGTIVTLSTDNGGSLDNGFAGTTFNDDADPDGQIPYTNNNGVTSDHLYVNLTPAGLLTPEEPLAAFIGEDPNGTWTLTISDDTSGDGGMLNSWSIDIVTCACEAPTLCPADINDDGLVDVNDLLLLIGAWSSADPDADINDDGIVDVNDLLLLIGAWGDCP